MVTTDTGQAAPAECGGGAATPREKARRLERFHHECRTVVLSADLLDDPFLMLAMLVFLANMIFDLRQ
jgi:hypothetical protein